MTADALDELRREHYEIAEAIAPTWERRRAFVEASVPRVREWMLSELGAAAGDTVLELAAGTGDTGFGAAAMIGEHGRLVTSDFSPSMLDAARRRGAALGVDNVEYQLLDAEQIELDADTVDGVLCRFAYMLMPDPLLALRETHRVLRPAGRVALAVWSAPERNPFFLIAGSSLGRRGLIPPLEPPPAPGAFSLASALRTSALLDEAGFDHVRTEEVPVHFAVAGADEYLAIVADTSGPLGLAVQGLSEPDLATTRADAENALLPFTSGEGFELPGVALCAVATRPDRG